MERADGIGRQRFERIEAKRTAQVDDTDRGRGLQTGESLSRLADGVIRDRQDDDSPLGRLDEPRASRDERGGMACRS